MTSASILDSDAQPYFLLEPQAENWETESLMKKPRALVSALSLVLFFVLTLGVRAQEPDAGAPLSKCDEHYAARADLSQVELAYQCYQAQAEEALTLGASVVRQTALEKSLLSAVWMINKSRPKKEDKSDGTPEKTEVRKKYLKGMQPIVESLNAEFPNAGSGPYWRAVFESFDCGEMVEEISIEKPDTVGQGLVCLFGRLGTIAGLLEQALNRDAAYHCAGPSRTLAYMHIELSKRAMSTPKAALKHATGAYTRSPLCSLNAVVYARALLMQQDKDREKKRARAKEILEKFVASDPYDPKQNDPSMIQEAIDDQVEARALLSTL